MNILPDEITCLDITNYLRLYNPENKKDYRPSSRTIKANKNSILFYYREVLGKNFKPKTKRKVDKKYLPTVTQE